MRKGGWAAAKGRGEGDKGERGENEGGRLGFLKNPTCRQRKDALGVPLHCVQGHAQGGYLVVARRREGKIKKGREKGGRKGREKRVSKASNMRLGLKGTPRMHAT